MSLNFAFGFSRTLHLSAPVTQHCERIIFQSRAHTHTRTSALQSKSCVLNLLAHLISVRHFFLIIPSDSSTHRLVHTHSNRSIYEVILAFFHYLSSAYPRQKSNRNGQPTILRLKSISQLFSLSQNRSIQSAKFYI